MVAQQNAPNIIGDRQKKASLLTGIDSDYTWSLLLASYSFLGMSYRWVNFLIDLVWLTVDKWCYLLHYH